MNSASRMHYVFHPIPSQEKLTPAAMAITLALGLGLPLSASAEDSPQQPADQAQSAAPAAPAASEDGKVLQDVQEALNKNDFEKAVQLLTPLAEKKNGEACYVLGRLTAEGKGTKASRTRAAKLYETSAQQGDMRGQNAYGQALAMGDGIRRNFGEAAKWFGKAADQGSPQPSTTLATCMIRAVAWQRAKTRPSSCIPGQPIRDSLRPSTASAGSI